MPPRKKFPRPADAIEVRGARQNNLKGIDLDLPLYQLNVITGPSGSGKSSLAFQTIYAEGQRRYVETFSPYTRQFFDRMDKPQVDEIRGIPPAIAIEQANNVRTTRSTVGTITEINDYLKLLFPRLATATCPSCKKEVKPDTPSSVLDAAQREFAGKPVLITFGIPVPAKTAPSEFFAFLQNQGFLRVRVYGETYRTDDPDKYTKKSLPAVVTVIQDRVPTTKERRTRFSEAVESALQFGKGQVTLIEPESGSQRAFSTRWHCADCDIEIRPPTSSLFTFNNALGACPKCRGFGRTIGIDLEKAIPDEALSLADGAVKAFQGERGSECQDDLIRCARTKSIDTEIPFMDLPAEERQWVLEGEDGDPEELWAEGSWYGVRGFFDWMETKAYKMHVRVFLSRYRSYTKCRACNGGRLQPEALHFRIAGKTLPEFWHIPIDELLPFFESLCYPKDDSTCEMLHREITSRLHYLDRVGLGYLDLDRPTRTLSGGEVERVNLTTCLGASLVNTLFVLDEPSVGLHPRDTGRLVEIMRGLRDKGNTLLVVEHEESIIRAADNLIDIGPGRGESGGELVFSGPLAELPRAKNSLTADYLSGTKGITVPAARRPLVKSKVIKIGAAAQNNLKRIDVTIPLGLFVCVTGVSGSGKSTLVHSVLYRNVLRKRGQRGEDEPGKCRDITGHQKVGEIVMVDQSPLARTPRSTPAVYTGAFDIIRKIFAELPDSKAAALTPGFFSFNSGGGRCERCSGTGFEKVEMQFLSDLFVRCPECEGKRYQPAALDYQLEGHSISDILELTVTQAIELFGSLPERKPAQVIANLQTLADVGLGYLRLGQPLNTLSGGESQRLKLVGHLTSKQPSKDKLGSLLIFDEPTTGLHFDDINLLLKVFQRLVDNGDTVLVIEHNIEVIKCADHVIDLGPEAGKYGGEIVATGTPEKISQVKESHTGRYLAESLFPESTLRVAEAPSPVSYLPSSRRDSGAIELFGAREHNLKDIDVSLPRDKFVVVTGLSGSGKSTLAFDIVFAEGQRRFLDSMSTYARQFVEQLERPDIDRISGVPPTVAIEQRISRGGGKSTVATVTETYHFLRLLFAKTGTQFCPNCAVAVEAQSESAIATAVAKAARSGGVRLLAPVIKARKGFHTEVAEWALRQGFESMLVDGELKPAEGFQKLTRFQEHTIDVVVDVLPQKSPPAELRSLISKALRIGKGTIKLLLDDGSLKILSSEMSCPTCGLSFEELDPRLFSYNSPHGWCRACRGYGQVHTTRTTFDDQSANSVLEAELIEENRLTRADDTELATCPECEGARLNPVARSVFVNEYGIEDIARLPALDAAKAVAGLTFDGSKKIIARDILTEIAQRLRFMDEVGLGYLQLDRSAKTLSGGEAQRIRLASQLGSNLRGVLYVLDEPTIGLHPRDNAALLDTLGALRDKGNSLLVVEHDEETMLRSDHIIDLGPGAGMFGGEVVASGTLAQIKKDKASPTGNALRNPMPHPVNGKRRKLPGKSTKNAWLRVKGAHANNLQNIDAAIPIGRLTVISGISGSGKSSLMRGVFKPAADAILSKSKKKKTDLPYKSATGFDNLAAVYEVDQSPIGKTSRSTPSTYVKLFDEIRKLYAGVPESRVRGYTASRFSFNTDGGRCPTCKGNGQIKLEMNFLPTTWIPCDDCHGLRYNEPTLEINYNGKNIGQALRMTIDEATHFFEAHPKIHRTLKLLADTGLGYLQLGQPSPTLSGGEAQRVKLVTELTRGVGRAQYTRLRKNQVPKSNLYLIEEPTIGLHMADVRRLIDVLHRLVDDGHTVVVIEHNLDVIKEADHLIDIGPEAGADGGKIIVQGTPEQVAKSKTSRTAPFLRS